MKKRDLRKRSFIAKRTFILFSIVFFVAVAVVIALTAANRISASNSGVDSQSSSVYSLGGTNYLVASTCSNDLAIGKSSAEISSFLSHPPSCVSSVRSCTWTDLYHSCSSSDGYSGSSGSGSCNSATSYSSCSNPYQGSCYTHPSTIDCSTSQPDKGSCIYSIPSVSCALPYTGSTTVCASPCTSWSGSTCLSRSNLYFDCDGHCDVSSPPTYCPGWQQCDGSCGATYNPYCLGYQCGSTCDSSDPGPTCPGYTQCDGSCSTATNVDPSLIYLLGPVTCPGQLDCSNTCLLGSAPITSCPQDSAKCATRCLT